MNVQSVDQKIEPTIASMVETLLEYKTGLDRGWYKAGDGVVYVEKLSLDDNNDALRLVYTKDSAPNSQSQYSHLVVSKDGTVIVNLEANAGINGFDFRPDRKTNSGATYGPVGENILITKPAAIDLNYLLGQIAPRGGVDYEKNIISLVQSWANENPPFIGTKQPFCQEGDWPSTKSGRIQMMDIGIDAATRIVDGVVTSKLGTAAEFLRVATVNLRICVLKDAEGSTKDDNAQFQNYAKKIIELASSLKSLSESSLEPTKDARLTRFINSKVAARTENLLARLEDLDEIRRDSSGLTGELPEGRRERAAKQALLDKAVPQVRYLTESSLALLKEEWNGIPIDLGGRHSESAAQAEIAHEIETHFSRKDQPTFLVEWEGDWTPHGVVVNGSPILGMQNQMVGLQDHGYNGVDYERIIRDGGESGQRQMILLFVPNGTADSVHVDKYISYIKNLDRIDRGWLK